jgi:hypothetical protein
MRKSQRPRGQRGMRGPAGPAGKTGARGKTGPTGHKGAAGARGLAGDAGAAETLSRSDGMDMMTVVEAQITDIYHQLDVQMQRMAHIQAELDDLRVKIRILMGTEG